MGAGVGFEPTLTDAEVIHCQIGLRRALWAFAQLHSLKASCDGRKAGGFWQSLPLRERDFLNTLMFELSRELAEIHALPKSERGNNRTGPTVPPELGPGGELNNSKECPTDADGTKG